MPLASTVCNRLTAIAKTRVRQNVFLASYTRFAIGGPADVLVETAASDSFVQALDVVKSESVPHVVIGGGSNLIVADAGFEGVVLRYTGRGISREGTMLRVEAGALLQDVVDASIASGLDGLQTMTGIPGEVGGAIYGNAGAYGRSIQEIVEAVHWTDGKQIRCFDRHACAFTYRESIFKRNKDWIVLSADLRFRNGPSEELAQTANGIRSIRDAKYPPSMKCAGSIFKNLLFAQLPDSVQQRVPATAVREGKVASAWFLEQADVKGLRIGDIQVAAYHANLIYNDGAGTAADLAAVIRECKARVRDQFGFELEEEVQYLG